MQLSFGQILAVSVTATAASIGAAGIPQVSDRMKGTMGCLLAVVPKVFNNVFIFVGLKTLCTFVDPLR